jgi:phenylacetate-coenzyme A ligase PaaK-like adenylate-forming protein
VAFARAESPYYRELYQGLPEHIIDPTLLPATSKKKLMARFDDWVADRSVTLSEVQTFLSKPELIGTPFHDKYLVATTSGSTGTPGVFLLDNYNHRAVRRWAARAMLNWLTLSDIIRLLRNRARSAVVVATGAHFVAVATISAVARSRFGGFSRVFSAQMPLNELVDELNKFRPAILTGYASMIMLLANEQQAGRLCVHPVIVGPSSEALPASEFQRLKQIFGARHVGMSYVATEALGIANTCELGWLHLDSDFVIAEPVDANHQRVPAGVQSHSVLITNLANRIQPILRYELGDSIWQRPEACECGSPFPAIRVQGRTSDLLRFTRRDGLVVSLAPLQLQTAVDFIQGIDQFQIVQISPETLRVHLRFKEGANAEEVWKTVDASLMKLLSSQKISHVEIEHASEPPEYRYGFKFRSVIPLGGGVARVGPVHLHSV